MEHPNATRIRNLFLAGNARRVFGLDPAAKDQRLKHLAAPGIPIDSPVMVTDMIMDGNLGQPFLTQYVMTIDLANSRLWLAPNVR